MTTAYLPRVYYLGGDGIGVVGAEARTGGRCRVIGYGGGEMKFMCRISEDHGLWKVEHASQDIGPIRVTGSTREEAVRKMDGEIHYWLEMCPCSGQAYRDVEIELVESA